MEVLKSLKRWLSHILGSNDNVAFLEKRKESVTVSVQSFFEELNRQRDEANEVIFQAEDNIARAKEVKKEASRVVKLVENLHKLGEKDL